LFQINYHEGVNIRGIKRLSNHLLDIRGVKLHKRGMGYQSGGRSVTTYLFLHVLDNYGEFDMWKIFQRWGKVKEVFIVRKLNRWGNRFGFVRFLDVKNVGLL